MRAESRGIEVKDIFSGFVLVIVNTPCLLVLEGALYCVSPSRINLFRLDSPHFIPVSPLNAVGEIVVVLILGLAILDDDFLYQKSVFLPCIPSTFFCSWLE